jgi:FlaA1/EpsC-like NDP-sugar epimerase
VELALAYDVQRFVNISTDKAVRPASVMGATKRVAELIVEHAAQVAKPGQCLVSVRFGNVLGSHGSVVPIFKEQIQAGGPLTITHPEMTRYFMSIPEATQLVLQAAGLTENSAIYILDMGVPVRIVDLARDLIRLSGFEPETDIEIKYIGMRPGEKLHEELIAAELDTTVTKYEKIHILHKNGKHRDRFNTLLEELVDAAKQGDGDQIRTLLKLMIPNYQPTATDVLEISASVAFVDL